MKEEKYLEIAEKVSQRVAKKCSNFKTDQEDIAQEFLIYLWGKMDELLYINDDKELEKILTSFCEKMKLKIYKEEHEKGLWIEDQFYIDEDGNSQEDNIAPQDIIYNVETYIKRNGNVIVMDEYIKNVMQYRKDYYQYHKKERIEYAKKYYQENKERIIEYTKKYYQENKDEIVEYIKRYNQEHREYLNERQRKYYKEHKEEIKEYRKKYMRKYYQEHKEHLNEQQRKYRKRYYQEHKDEIKAKTAKYYQEHKEKFKEHKSEYDKKYYQEHRDEINAKKRERRMKKKLAKLENN